MLFAVLKEFWNPFKIFLRRSKAVKMWYFIVISEINYAVKYLTSINACQQVIYPFFGEKEKISYSKVKFCHFCRLNFTSDNFST